MILCLIKYIAFLRDQRCRNCAHRIILSMKQEANEAFVNELGKYFIVKRVPRCKLHPGYKNDLVEILRAKLKKR